MHFAKTLMPSQRRLDIAAFAQFSFEEENVTWEMFWRVKMENVLGKVDKNEFVRENLSHFESALKPCLLMKCLKISHSNSSGKFNISTPNTLK